MDFKVVPFNVDVMTGTEATGARRLLLLDERKVDLALFFFVFLSDNVSNFSGTLPFLFSSLASEIIARFSCKIYIRVY